MLKVTVTPYWIALHFVTDAKRTVKFSVRSCLFTCVSCQFLMRWMCSVSGNIRFVRSYQFACSKLRMDATGWRCSVDERFLCVSMWFVRFSCVRHPVGILYVSLDVRSSWAVEPSTSGHVTIKTDEYRMLNGQETHIMDAKRWFMRSKQCRLSFIGTRFDPIPYPTPYATQSHILISFLNFTWEDVSE